MIDGRPAHLVKESDVTVFAATGRVTASAGCTTLRVRTWQKLPCNAEAYQAALQHVAEIIMAARQHG